MYYILSVFVDCVITSIYNIRFGNNFKFLIGIQTVNLVIAKFICIKAK